MGQGVQRAQSASGKSSQYKMQFPAKLKQGRPFLTGWGVGLPEQGMPRTVPCFLVSVGAVLLSASAETPRTSMLLALSLQTQTELTD